MCAHTLLAYTLSLLPPPSASVLILFFKEDITDIFCESVSIKEPQTRSQNKETTVQNYQEMSNQNTKKSPGIEIVLFNCTGETRIDNSGRLNSSLSSFYSYFVTNLRKKIWRTYVYCWTSAPPPYEPIRFQLDHPSPPSDRMYFMDDPISNIWICCWHFERVLEKRLCISNFDSNNKKYIFTILP